MKKYYFTFGIGQTLLANRYVEIEAEDFEEARCIMKESFGDCWAMQYAEEDWVKNQFVYKYGLLKLNVNEFWK